MTISEKEVWAALPEYGFLRAFCTYLHHASDAPLAFGLGAGLSTLAVFAPDVGMTYGAPLYPNFWSILVGLSSETRKTTVVNAAERMIGTVDASRKLNHPESGAALVEGLANCPQSILVFGEMGDFFASTAKGSYKADLRQKMMSAWDGSALSKGKVGGKVVIVPAPRLSLIGGVAPSFLEEHTSGADWLNGSMSRYCLLMADRERTYEPPPDDPPGFDFAVQELFSLASLAPSIGPCTGWGGPETIDLWRLGCAEIATSAVASGWNAGSIDRAKVTALKAAILYSFDVGQARASGVAGDGRPWALDLDAIRFGLEVGKMHARSVLAILDQLSYSLYEAQRRRVLAVFEDGKMHTFASVLKHVQPKMKKRDLLGVVETMLEAGDLHEVKATSGGPYLWAGNPPIDPGTGNPLVWTGDAWV